MKRLSRFMFFVIVMWIITFPLPITAQDVLPSNETVVMNYLNLVYSQGAVSAAIPLLTSDAVIHDPVAETYGITGLVENLTDLHWRVGNLTMIPYTAISEGNMVVVPYMWDATTIADNPYGSLTPVSGNAVEFFRIENGKIAEIWRHTEWHDFSILGSEEDYRGQSNLVRSVASSVEMTGIPMLSDALPAVSMVETTGIPSLADFPGLEADTPMSPVVADTGIPMLVDMVPGVSQNDEAVVLNWLESYNQGRINQELMLPEFTFHTCPCATGVGTLDATSFVATYENALVEQVVPLWTPLVPEQGFTMVSEGGLTALLYHAPFSNADGVAIFRVENGLLAEAWQF